MNIVNKLSIYTRGKIDDKSEIFLRKKYIQCDGKSRNSTRYKFAYECKQRWTPDCVQHLNFYLATSLSIKTKIFNETNTIVDFQW